MLQVDFKFEYDNTLMFSGNKEEIFFLLGFISFKTLPGVPIL